MLRNLRIALSVLICIIAAVIVTMWVVHWDAMTVPGVIVGTAATFLLVLSEKEGALRAWTWILYLLVAGVNVLMTLLAAGVLGAGVGAEGLGTLLAWQWVWVVLGLTLLVVIPLRDRQVIRDAQLARSAQSAAERARHEERMLAEQRQRELEHAQQVERVRLAADRATTPGELTGYEPQRLAGLELQRPALMFGDPGAGLSGAGFDQASVKRGQEGELNFAKSLQKAGLLARFSSFWSVHVPDAELGANRGTEADVDCVLVSGSTLWLLDMKNYVQGGVVWRTEDRFFEDLGELRHEVLLSAIDRQTGGYVGRPRPMSSNMSAAAQTFEQRLERSGLPFQVRPVVVMMPQRDGIGTIEDVLYPGGVPAVGLPELLEWLCAEEPFAPDTEESKVLVAILKTLLKDESGSAIILDSATGRRREVREVTEERNPFESSTSGDSRWD